MSTRGTLTLEVCGCCGQVIPKIGYGAVIRHAKTIEELYGFSLEDLKTPGKRRRLAQARQHFWLLLCVEEEWSYPRAGEVTGHEYTTVLSGLRSICHEFFGTSKRKANLYEMVKAYWLAVGLSEELADAKAKKRAKR